MSDTLRVALYLRVSTSEQDVAAQRLELTEYCRRQGWTVVGEFSDVVSGAKASRPGLDALLMECAASRVDVVAVVKIDRLGRSVANVMRLVERLNAMRVGVIATSQNIDTRAENPMARFIFTIMSAFAEMERGFIRERTVAGLRVARAAGKTLGRPSPNLVDVELREPIVRRWRKEGRPGGLRGLGRMLGGVSQTTAQKIDRRYQPEPGLVRVAVGSGA